MYSSRIDTDSDHIPVANQTSYWTRELDFKIYQQLNTEGADTKETLNSLQLRMFVCLAAAKWYTAHPCSYCHVSIRRITSNIHTLIVSQIQLGHSYTQGIEP